MELEPRTRLEKYLAKISGLNVDTPNPITRVEAFLDNIKGGGSATSYHDLTDKPFDTETTPDITFTAEDIANPIERLEPSDGGGMTYVKVSDRVFTADELDGMSVTYIPGGDMSESVTDNNPFIDKEHTMTPVGIMFGSHIDGTAIGVVIEQEMAMGEDVVLSTGLWLIAYGANSSTRILSVTIPGKETIKQLDSKFLNPALQFGETTVTGDTLTWDGNTDGLVSVVESFYKVADNIVTADELANGFSYTFDYGEVVEGPAIELANGVLSDGDAVIFVDENGAGAIIEALGVAFPEPGIYLAGQIGEFYVSSLTIPGYNGFGTTTIKTIDAKYLPETASPDWNAAEGEPGHINNKPFGTETTPDFVFTDADIANPIERIEIPDSDGLALVKVSERAFSVDELSGVSVSCSYDGTEVRTDDNPLIVEQEFDIVILSEKLQISVGNALTKNSNLGFDDLDDVFSPGFWIYDYPAESGLKILNVTIPSKETIKQLDSKFLNPALQFGTDEQVVITWEGNVTGMEPILYSATKEAAYYWVSDFAPEASRVYRKAMVSGLQYAGTTVENELMSLNCNPKDPPDDIVEIPNWGIIVYKAGSELPNFSRPFDKTGIYFRRRGDGYANGYQADKMVFPEVVHPMDEKFMPILTSPNGTKFRLAVNDDGTVTTAEVTE